MTPEQVFIALAAIAGLVSIVVIIYAIRFTRNTQKDNSIAKAQKPNEQKIEIAPGETVHLDIHFRTKQRA